MARLTLIRGNRNYSSWSYRAWLALMAAGAEFDELAFDLAAEGVREAIRQHSPTGRVPALRDGDLVIWDSLAIAETLAERYPEAGLWPADPKRRAVARSAAAEMHSGFPAIRRELPFNARREKPRDAIVHEVAAEIRRVESLWADCLDRADDGGAFLFGRWSLADVMYAPVVSRFRSYCIDVTPASSRYMQAVEARDDVRQWYAAAAAEPEVNPLYEV